MDQILNKVFMYIWLVVGIVAVVTALFGASHQLFTALICLGFYIVARCDWKKEQSKNITHNDEESE